MAANKASKDDQYVESLRQILKESSYTYIRLEQLSEDTSATVEADSEGKKPSFQVLEQHRMVHHHRHKADQFHAMRIQLSVSSSMDALYKSRLVVLQQIESSCCLVPLSDVWLLTAAALVLAAGAVALASTQHCLDLCHHVQLL